MRGGFVALWKGIGRVQGILLSVMMVSIRECPWTCVNSF